MNPSHPNQPASSTDVLQTPALPPQAAAGPVRPPSRDALGAPARALLERLVRHHKPHASAHPCTAARLVCHQPIFAPLCAEMSLGDICRAVSTLQRQRTPPPAGAPAKRPRGRPPKAARWGRDQDGHMRWVHANVSLFHIDEAGWSYQVKCNSTFKRLYRGFTLDQMRQRMIDWLKINNPAELEKVWSPRAAKARAVSGPSASAREAEEASSESEMEDDDPEYLPGPARLRVSVASSPLASAPASNAASPLASPRPTEPASSAASPRQAVSASSAASSPRQAEPAPSASPVRQAEPAPSASPVRQAEPAPSASPVRPRAPAHGAAPLRYFAPASSASSPRSPATASPLAPPPASAALAPPPASPSSPSASQSDAAPQALLQAAAARAPEAGALAPPAPSPPVAPAGHAEACRSVLAALKLDQLNASDQLELVRRVCTAFGIA